jgi:hypothetical protein
MNEELESFRSDLYLEIGLESHVSGLFTEESFFNVVADKLSSAGVVDNAQYSNYKNSKLGIRVDGYSWNELERTFNFIISDVGSSDFEIETLTNTEVQKLFKRLEKFIDYACKNKISDEDMDTAVAEVASLLDEVKDQILKYRLIVITDSVLSSRFKLPNRRDPDHVEKIYEIWDLERLMNLEYSSGSNESFTVSEEFFGEGLPIIKASQLTNGTTSYLGVMPASILSNIYDHFGQRLLESNVRTFLDFRSGVNKGLRRSLVTEPENFFAYNNGITVTADAADIVEIEGVYKLKSLQNMQIVNGGQTTASIYFSPREAGSIKTDSGEMAYRSIDLNKVSVQMKLTVLKSDDPEFSDSYKASISQYANSQNSVQQSDLVSNHPFHLAIERLSRVQLCPPNNSGLAQKWFYERTRGQYSTKLRALSAASRKKFELEFPKTQSFSKTDLAKYENTWRMNPHIVKKGAQANLKLLGTDLIKEYESRPIDFEAGYFQDLIAKMILFRTVDKAILKTDWYKSESGLKAEAVTFSISLVRFKLRLKKADLNLRAIYKEQRVSSTLLEVILAAAEKIRRSISDSNFRGGTGNPSEFCKTERGWKKIQTIDIDLSGLRSADVVSSDQVLSQTEEKKEINRASKSVSDYTLIFNKGSSYWSALSTFFLKQHYPLSSIQVSLMLAASKMANGGAMMSDKQVKAALKFATEAESEGFEYSSD